MATISAETARRKTRRREEPVLPLPGHDVCGTRDVSVVSATQPQSCGAKNRSTIERLRKLLGRYHERQRGIGGRRSERIPTGFAALDGVLPHGGLPAGSVIEVLSDGLGIGARTLALRAARHAAAISDVDELNSAKLLTLTKTVVVVDCDGDFYPPAAVAMGIPADRLLIVRVSNSADAFWATDQALGCQAVGAVIATRLVLDDVRSRRLQLATEHSGGLALILAPSAGAAGRHTFAAVQLLIEPVAPDAKRAWAITRHLTEPRAPATDLVTPRRRSGFGLAAPIRARWFSSFSDTEVVRRCRITVLKVREGMPVEPVIVGLSDETFDVPLHPVPADRAAGSSPATDRRLSA